MRQREDFTTAWGILHAEVSSHDIGLAQSRRPSGADQEVDLSAGYRETFGNTTVDGGVLYCYYPGSGGIFRLLRTLSLGLIIAIIRAGPDPDQGGIADAGLVGRGIAVLFYAIDKVFGLRPSADVGREGLDINEHGERAYNY